MSRGPAVAEKSARTAAAPARARAPAGPLPQPGLPDIGNLAMQDLMGGGLRAKLAIGGMDDPEEREADSIAKAVASGSRAPCTCGGTCEKCVGGTSAGGGAIRRKPVEGRGGGRTPHSIAASAFAGPGRPIDMATRRHFEARLGTGLSHVRLHDDTRTASMAATIGARAYAAGNDIGFARGELSPNTPGGRSLLAHELAHVVMGHGGVRRVGMDDGLSKAEIEAQLEQARKMAEEEAKHRAWQAGVGERWQKDLAGQGGDMASERERIGLSLSGVQAKGFDEAGAGSGWLVEEMKNGGYSGPSIGEVKQFWAEALVAADAVKLSAESKPIEEGKPAVGAETKLAALTAIEAYYAAASQFSKAAEDAHKRHADAENARAAAQYRDDLARFESAYQTTVKDMRGDLGGRAAAASMALVKPSLAPRPPVTIIPPPAISQNFAAYAERFHSAATDEQWKAVAADVRTSAAAIGKLITDSLPAKSTVVVQALGIERLLASMDKLEKENKTFKRIPAVFYPKDAHTTKMDDKGNSVLIPDAIPWHFYLVHQVRMEDNPRMCVEQGEWVLFDLTNPPAKNEYPSSLADSQSIAAGKWVDPPVDLFTPLNSKLRFPEGELYFAMPSGKPYVHVGSSRVDLQACKLEYSIVSPK